MNKEEKLYVSLCNNPIIQGRWIPHNGDLVKIQGNPEIGKIFYSCRSARWKCCFEATNKIEIEFEFGFKKVIFLPSLEQLLEAMGERFLQLSYPDDKYSCWIGITLMNLKRFRGSSRRIACLKALLEIRKEEEMIEKPKKILHTHDSIPCCTGEEKNGCVLCIRNKSCDEWEKFLPSLIEIQNIIDIWIHENGLGNYDKIPKIKEYNKLAKAIAKRLEETNEKE